jgi:CheY-like chemotaxis protein
MIISQPSIVALRGRLPSRASQFAALLQDFYQDLLEQGVPEDMANLVRQLPEGERPALAGDRPVALVVESDPDVRALAATLLEETDLSVVECTSAEAALSILQRQGERIAFIFADEALAGPRDGRDLARSVTTLWPHVHVVVTLARESRPTDLPEGVLALRKPWRGLDLLLAAERAAAEAGS